MKEIIRNCAGAAGLMLAASTFAAGTLSVSREVIIDRTPSTVWKLVGNFDALDIWLPPVLGSSSEGDGTRPGAVRTLDLGANARVVEKLLTYDAPGRTYTYAFVESPLPVKNYVATIEVTPAPGGATRIKWHSTFDAEGAPAEKAQDAIRGIYDAGLAKITSIFGK